MRLDKIKLAGFKSFVDPTVADFPTNLVAVVGPNGCGKSNIIDAVRWVMGESSAKMLRGDSMADVIFNGSSSRKPIGAASIELIFDNSDGSAGGQYAGYNEISVKRRVSRDGQSIYFLNNTRCRRRDITDLFLGTGLGPRSYSIIEQGMISRVIEARPEDLRVYLEEAAGISKYKERRRETENRIRHTRENLERLEDLLEEISSQLKRLKRQAATAEKYRELKALERNLRGELLVLRWQLLEGDLQQGERQLAQLENRLEESISMQRRVEAEIEADRLSHTEANEAFNSCQAAFYAQGADIAALEQAILFARESREKQQQELGQKQASLQHLMQEQKQDERRLEELTAELRQQQPLLEAALEAEQQADHQLTQAEEALQQWQSEWDGFHKQANEPAQTAQVERTHINHLEQQQQQLQRRIERNREESSRLHVSGLDEEIIRYEEQQGSLAASVEGAQAKIDTTQAQIAASRERLKARGEHLDSSRRDLQGATGRLASLQALQQAAMQEGGESAAWLAQQGLDKAQRLARQIDVDADWRRALETVLGHHLQAVCIDRIEDFSTSVDKLRDGVVELLGRDSTEQATVREGSLLGKVCSEIDLSAQLAGILVADSVSDALARRHALQPGESLITTEGVWVGRNWMRFGQEQGAKQGVLEREQAVRELKESCRSLQTDVENLQQQHESAGESLREMEQQREQRQLSLNQLNHELSEVRSKLSGKRMRAEHIRNRVETLGTERSDLQKQTSACEESVQQAQRKLYQALEISETMESKRAVLEQQRDHLRSQVDTVREQNAAKRQGYHQLALKSESMRSQQQGLLQGTQRINEQLQQIRAQHDELQEALGSNELPLKEQQQELEAQLQRRVAAESELAAARDALQQIDNSLRSREKQRHEAEQQVQQHRSFLEQERIKHQEIAVRAKTLEEQLDEGSYDREKLLQGIPEDADVSEWQQQLERTTSRIQRLGSINLAAIDEYREQSERLDHLMAQQADVLKSLATLEEAIHKIDRETRNRFKDTFEMVNSGFVELFPKLFGGGKAYLQLTGDDLLNTGVGVMARPPGKRNSSIQLLSGGEKALTAVALVFAIFRLNPAPFCMLDEVDAPLDDANVGRFCTLVKEMSETVQFIFITHNKITMELANQLQGVTMHEPGVSRLVSVDVEEAAQMAAM
ncbi:MAG: chromosome segregation protein SMC [Pseudomonadota bacterium]